MSENIDHTCQIYLISPPVIENIDDFCATLTAVLSAAPVTCFQLRLKDMNGNTPDDSAIIQIASAIREICHGNGTLFLLNDRPDLALKVRADGVHIGQSDMAANTARKLLGKEAIIGVTCHDSKELAFEAAQMGADYVAFGAFFETSTKTTQYRPELELLTWWQEAIEIPCVAIGGITPENAEQVIKAGADFIAISSSVWDSAAPIKAIKDLSNLCQSNS